MNNFDAFYNAYDIKEGDKIYLDNYKTVKIW